MRRFIFGQRAHRMQSSIVSRVFFTTSSTSFMSFCRSDSAFVRSFRSRSLFYSSSSRYLSIITIFIFTLYEYGSPCFVFIIADAAV